MIPPRKAPSQKAEDRLDDLLLERGRELDEQVARLAETVTDLERREELVRDSRASVERVLRVGSRDLDSRESELVELARDLAVREERLRAGEADLAQRRGELGAVELKRGAVERRERVLADREAQLAARETELDERGSDLSDVGLVFVPGVSYRLAEIRPTRLMPRETLELEGDGYEVARIGPSPLPGDARRCAYLLQGVSSQRLLGSSSDGSS